MPERRLVFAVLGLLVVQGMLVHVNQWFGLSMVAALHPVNALVLTYAAISLAKRSSAYWQTDAVGANSTEPFSAGSAAATFTG